MRILLNPEPAEGGNGTPATATPPAKAAETPPSPPAPNPLAAELAALRSQLAEFEKDKTDRAKAAQDEEEKKLAAKGEFDKLIKQRDEQLANEKKSAAESLERSKKWALKSSLVSALAKHELYEGSAEDLYELWAKDFETVADGDGWNVRHKDGRPVADVIAERLATPRYSNHVKATARSGSNGGGGNTPAPTQNPQDGKPASYEEWTKQVLGIDESRPSPLFGLTGRRPTK